MIILYLTIVCYIGVYHILFWYAFVSRPGHYYLFSGVCACVFIYLALSFYSLFCRSFPLLFPTSSMISAFAFPFTVRLLVSEKFPLFISTFFWSFSHKFLASPGLSRYSRLFTVYCWFSSLLIRLGSLFILVL